MASESRQKRSPIDFFDEISQAPWEFGFYQTVRDIEAVSADKPRLGNAVMLSDEPIRLGQTPSLSFAPAALSGFSKANQFRAVPRLDVNFQGLLGPNGPMPLHITEYVYQRERHHNDSTLRNFLNIFNHRLLSLFYRAWANTEPVCNADRDDDRFRKYIGAFLGISLDTMTHRDNLDDNVKLSNAANFSNPTKTTDGLSNICANFLQAPVNIVEYVGHWLELPEEGYTVLSEVNIGCDLGKTAVLGANVWDRHSKFAIEIGPLDYSEYKDLLPTNPVFTALTDLIKNYIGFEFLWEARLIIKSSQIPELKLSGRQGLGWNCWVGDPGDKDRMDLALQL
ncbi:type VI secretion system baseplate subunit TssG [Pelagibaculum spongiae]|uniref:Type VI secretion system baseplate subunit TssG n=1 Tax=Pelagibaculum spongiae TaxID=2080658 RepID=A0A2V1GZY6_9GAMM|nr:type VI secretion system baseplate subunit TssG [Pelagibaculum spongiae]PVZ67689.1 type VI secretion system baseplate subunit TssG [Pelagibaculum spongiae]